jgi:hypothetical protein
MNIGLSSILAGLKRFLPSIPSSIVTLTGDTPFSYYVFEFIDQDRLGNHHQ